jgi:hypothetical protein
MTDCVTQGLPALQCSSSPWPYACFACAAHQLQTNLDEEVSHALRPYPTVVQGVKRQGWQVPLVPGDKQQAKSYLECNCCQGYRGRDVDAMP